MKKLIFLLSITLLFAVSCQKEKKTDEVKPTTESVVSDQSTENARINLCAVKTDLVKCFLYGHTWDLRYYNALNDSLLNVPGLFDPNVPNQIVWDTDGTGTEYYHGVEFNHGTFYVTDCGKTVTINTLFLSNAVMTLSELRPQIGHNPAKFVGNIPPSGNVPVPVKVIGARRF